MTQTIKIKTITVESRHLALCAVKSERATQLSRSEISALMSWCDCQTEALWDDLNLQEILNVYRVSAEYDTWEDWWQDDRAAAVTAYNSAVAPAHRMETE